MLIGNKLKIFLSFYFSSYWKLNTIAPLSVYENVEILVIEIFKARPTVKIPQLVLLAKEVADTGDEGAFEDIIE